MEFNDDVKIKMLIKNREILTELLKECCNLLTKEQIDSIVIFSNSLSECSLRGWLEGN